MKTGQTVQIISGSDKGKTGKVLQMFPDQNRVVVDGVNKMFKHVKQRRAGKTKQPQTSKGERVEFFGPIHVSNVKSVEANPEAKPQAEKKAEAKPRAAAKKPTKKSVKPTT